MAIVREPAKITQDMNTTVNSLLAPPSRTIYAKLAPPGLDGTETKLTLTLHQ